MTTRGVTVSNVLLAATMGLLSTAAPSFAGSMIIVGNGPELPIIERLARAFEKGHFGSVVEIQWDKDQDAVRMVKSGEAHVAVTGQQDPDLAATPIAWDGIAVVVYVGNPVKELTIQQVAAIFSGKVTQWAELNGQGSAIQLIDRPQDQHIRHSFEEALGIVGQIPKSAKVIRSDQTAMSTVAGNLSAVTYTSLRVALDAMKYGVDVHVLLIDQVEAAAQPVKDGRYQLRRPVLLLSRQEPNPVAEAFTGFALSKEGQDIISEMYTPYSPSDAQQPQQGPKP